MPRLLLFETATSVCSVATAENGNRIALQTTNEGYRHAENLLVMAGKVLEESGWTLAETDGLAVSAGPGSYTGLRIAVSAAKGICYALGKPLIAVPTLAVLAEGFRRLYPGFEGTLCPMIDARRMEVYTALFRSSGERLEEDHPLVVDEQSIACFSGIASPLSFFGDGAEKCRPLLEQLSQAHFDLPVTLSAQDMIPLAAKQYAEKAFADLAYFEPEYLKPYMGSIPQKR